MKTLAPSASWPSTCHRFLLFALPLLAAARLQAQDAPKGYYRFPAIHDDTIVFTAEGDLWRVGRQGGVAQRLTSHPGVESHAVFSPDGKTIAFVAEYEGPNEVYTMPIDGGLPTRRTFLGSDAAPVRWVSESKLIFTTQTFSTLPDYQLATLDLKTGETAVLPLAQAFDGDFDSSGKTLYFTRLPPQPSHTKRYKGGDIEHIWKYSDGDAEAAPLTSDFPGTSKNPMLWQDRVYFISDRDGTMNLWSMNSGDGDLRQLTHHKGWDVKSASLSNGRIVYQLGADLWLYDIASQNDALIPITLTSDFDQEREKWVKEPMDYLTDAELSPDGDRLALTARGQIFVAPARQGRFVDVTHDQTVRYHGAHFLPDGKSLLALSDATGELEFDLLAANGLEKPKQLTSGNQKSYRFDGLPSPNGRWVAFDDKDYKLWIFNTNDNKPKLIDTSKADGFSDLAWSPDSQWLAYVRPADNTYPQIWIYNTNTGQSTAITSDRVNSFSPAWDPDGQWLYFLSDRHWQTIVGSPWGLREPEPYFDAAGGVFYLSLLKDQRSPFLPNDELHPGDADKDKEKDKDKKEKPKDEAREEKNDHDAAADKDKDKKKDEAKESKEEKKDEKAPPEVKIDLPGIQDRVLQAPVPNGNYTALAMTAKKLFIAARGSGSEHNETSLKTFEISNDDPKLETFADHIADFQLSLDRKKILIRKDNNFYIVNSDSGSPAKLEKSVNLGGWTFPLNPRQEWRQMFIEAWRLERDFFYDPDLHHVDWPEILQRHLPLVERVTDRQELADLIADMVGELSALHTFVYGGDFRPTPEDIHVASLGARLSPDPANGGYRVNHIFQTDPDYPNEASPLARPSVDVHEGDVIQEINGFPALSQPLGALLRHDANRQVLLKVKTPGTNDSRQTIVNPVSVGEANGLRYDEWEYTRRLKTEELGHGDIGYIHLRAMGSADIARWARDFYPVFDRKGLIIDVRHNHGGNIDSWILEKLLRKAWFYWQGRVGEPTWNMQYAFRGHMVVICDQNTASDGEAFTEGFRRLGLGKVIGMRTWGGEIWLSSDNWLVDRGIATAAEEGVYGPEGKWLIEGHGVDPDIVVDNKPHATFLGQDAQLEKAVQVLQQEIKAQPVEVPSPPPHPDKSFK